MIDYDAVSSNDKSSRAFASEVLRCPSRTVSLACHDADRLYIFVVRRSLMSVTIFAT